jgi:hypothetical protein
MQNKTGLLGNVSNAFGGRQGLLTSGLGMMFGGNPQAQQQAMMMGLQQGSQLQAENRKTQAQAAQLNKTVEFLKQVNPELAQAVEMGAMSPKDAYSTHLKAQAPNNGASYGKSPIYGEDAEGNIVLGTIGDDASFKQIDTGDFTPSTGVTKVDLGDRIGIMNKRTGEIVGYEDKNLAEAERKKAIGKAQGANAANLGAATQGLDDTITLVDSVLEHPSLSAAVGPIDGRLPSFTAGARDFDERVEQIKNKAFLSARQELKGGGAITDYEGQKAETALVRASQAKSEADFIKAMNEFKQALARGKQLLAMQAGQPGAPQQTQTQNTGNITPASEYFK